MAYLSNWNDNVGHLHGINRLLQRTCHHHINFLCRTFHPGESTQHKLRGNLHTRQLLAFQTGKLTSVISPASRISSQNNIISTSFAAPFNLVNLHNISCEATYKAITCLPNWKANLSHWRANLSHLHCIKDFFTEQHHNIISTSFAFPLNLVIRS